MSVAAVVSEGAGDDPGGRGGVAVDEHDHREAADQVFTRPVERDPFDVAGSKADGAYDLAAPEEPAGHGGRLHDEAFWVPAKVQDET